MDHFDAPSEIDELDFLRLENKFLKFRLSQYKLKEIQEELVRRSNQVKDLKLSFEEAWEEFREENNIQEEDFEKWKEGRD